MGWILFVVVLACLALALLLREPFAEFRSWRRRRAQERKRAWRRQRDLEREMRSGPAMNPSRAAARKGPPRWQLVAERQGSKCWLCGTRTYPDDRQRVAVGNERLGAAYPTVDYVVAIDKGGTYEQDNVRIAHRQCSERRLANPGRTEFAPPKRTFPV